MLQLRIMQTFTRGGNHMSFPFIAYWLLFFCLFIQCVIGSSIQMDTALDCQDGGECLLWINPRKS